MKKASPAKGTKAPDAAVRSRAAKAPAAPKRAQPEAAASGPALAEAAAPPSLPPLAAASLPATVAAPKPATPEAEPTAAMIPSVDIEALSLNLARAAAEGGKALAAWLRPFEEGRIDSVAADNVADAARTLGRVAEYWLADPERAVRAQTSLTNPLVELWAATLHRMTGEKVEDVVKPTPGDKRFADPEWRQNPFFDFLRQAYGLTTNWANELVARAQDVDPATRDRAAFYVRQIAGAVSPSNFLATNPELLRATLRENGGNLVRGMHMFAEDIEAGHGSLKIRQGDPTPFKLGVNMAATPGKVIFRNDLFELLQYAPATETVLKRPLLIVPPWINKFYVLDLNPEKSFVRWCVAQGVTVFVISWVNPDERQAEKGFDAYVMEGVIAALDAIEQATGERNVSAMGYCVGGTLLSVTLGYLAAIGDQRIANATLLATQVDFTDPGDLKHFVDPERIQSIEASMARDGYLPGSRMASAFNMLRPNDLIWNYFVSNYIKGEEPPAFDLLVWNSDSTRMPRANHSFYLRNCYLENNLSRGLVEILGQRIEIGRITIPIYALATREDHIAPPKSAFIGAGLFGGPTRYVLGGSGHIAGVVNPPDKRKYQYWTGDAPKGSYEDWLQRAVEHPGSWWSDWIEWYAQQSPERVPARHPGDGKLMPLGDAPGDYVRVKS